MFQGHGGVKGRLGNLFGGLEDGEPRRNTVEYMLALTNLRAKFSLTLVTAKFLLSQKLRVNMQDTPQIRSDFYFLPFLNLQNCFKQLGNVVTYL